MDPDPAPCLNALPVENSPEKSANAAAWEEVVWDGSPLAQYMKSLDSAENLMTSSTVPFEPLDEPTHNLSSVSEPPQLPPKQFSVDWLLAAIHRWCEKRERIAQISQQLHQILDRSDIILDDHWALFVANATSATPPIGLRDPLAPIWERAPHLLVLFAIAFLSVTFWLRFRIFWTFFICGLLSPLLFWLADAIYTVQLASRHTRILQAIQRDIAAFSLAGRRSHSAIRTVQEIELVAHGYSLHNDSLPPISRLEGYSSISEFRAVRLRQILFEALHCTADRLIACMDTLQRKTNAIPVASVTIGSPLDKRELLARSEYSENAPTALTSLKALRRLVYFVHSLLLISLLHSVATVSGETANVWTALSQMRKVEHIVSTAAAAVEGYAASLPEDPSSVETEPQNAVDGSADTGRHRLAAEGAVVNKREKQFLQQTQMLRAHLRGIQLRLQLCEDEVVAMATARSRTNAHEAAQAKQTNALEEVFLQYLSVHRELLAANDIWKSGQRTLDALFRPNNGEQNVDEGLNEQPQTEEKKALEQQSQLAEEQAIPLPIPRSCDVLSAMLDSEDEEIVFEAYTGTDEEDAAKRTRRKKTREERIKEQKEKRAKEKPTESRAAGVDPQTPLVVIQELKSVLATKERRRKRRSSSYQ